MAGLTDGQLGLAILCGGLGSLPALFTAGRLLDRFGRSTLVVGQLFFSAAGLFVAFSGRDFVSLCVGLALIGLGSGTVDVCLNAIAGSLERSTGRRVILRSHALFSTGFVVGSLGGALSIALKLPTEAPFAVLSGLGVAFAACVLLVRAATPHLSQEERASAIRSNLLLAPLIAVGLLAAVGLAMENAHEAWSALYLVDIQKIPESAAALGPAIFGGVLAVTRFALSAIPDRLTLAALVAAGISSTLGAGLLWLAPSLWIALIGLILASMGTAVLYPLMVSIVQRHVPEARRGAATGLVAGVAYAGFLLGPVYIGGWSEAVGLAGAFGAIAVLSLIFTIAVVPTVRRSERRHPMWVRSAD